jgi:diguanylate cyclase (GGDEF)-like protein
MTHVVIGHHDLRLVALAVVVCFVASCVAVSLLHRLAGPQGRARTIWIATAGAASGCGIWATHFIAMLAYEPGVVVGYDVVLTILSLVIASVVTSVGFALAVNGRASWSGAAGGAVVGVGIAWMHFTGMSALELAGHIVWAPGLVVLAIACGVVFGAASLALMRRVPRPGTSLAASVLLMLSIVSLHFIAMDAVLIVPDPARPIIGLILSPEALALAVAAAAGALLGMSVVASAADHRAKSMLRDRNLLLDAALNNMVQGVNMLDAQAQLVLFNQRYLQMYRLSPDMVKTGCTVRELVENRVRNGTFFVTDPERYIADLTGELSRDRTPKMQTFELEDGRVIAVNTQPMQGGGWVMTHEDITERQRAEARIAHMAHFDGLTDLPNRAAFNERLAATLERAAKEKGRFALLCIDLDRFKEVNDVFGHASGDTVLREIAQRLAGAAGQAFLARLGGDEFALIASSGAQPASAVVLADRIMGAVAGEFAIGGDRLRVGLSIGVAIFPADGADASSLLANAEAALHRAKTGGPGSIRFFAAEMDQRLRERRAMVHDLGSAVERGELLVYYQPQARIAGEITGFEALVRWMHPTRGLVAPNVFIPAAEESGLILEIGEWVLREACREAASWPKKLNIGINLSPVQFRHGDLPGLVHAVLLETGLVPGRLELEITESVLIDDFSRGVSILRRLKLLGVHISMDDFGTGYSSLSNLQAFAFDRIKVDRSFISSLQSNRQSATIVRAVIGLGHGLDLPVIAEGVETADQLSFLSLAACDEVQGFLVGKPLPIAAYAAAVGREPEPAAVASVA